MVKIMRALIKGIAFALGPLGAPLESWLRYQDDVVLERIEQSLLRIEPTQKLDMRIVEELQLKSDGERQALDMLEMILRMLMEDATVRDQLRLLAAGDEQTVESDVRQVVDRYLPMHLSREKISQLLYNGVLNANYYQIDRLWPDIKASGFRQADFPFGVIPLTDGADQFVNAFWRQPLATQETVLAQLAERNQAILEFHDAHLWHVILQQTLKV